MTSVYRQPDLFIQFPESVPDRLRSPFLETLRADGLIIEEESDRSQPSGEQIGGGAEVLIELGRQHINGIAENLASDALIGLFIAIAKALGKLPSWIARIRLRFQTPTGLRTVEHTTEPMEPGTDPKILESILRGIPKDAVEIVERVEETIQADTEGPWVISSLTIERRLRISYRQPADPGPKPASSAQPSDQ